MGALYFLPLGLVTLVVIAIFIVFFRLRRASPTGDYPLLSHLVCPRCGTNFDYSWVPFMSITAVRLLDSRFFACPLCHKRSVFNVWETRVDPRVHRCEIRLGPW